MKQLIDFILNLSDADFEKLQKFHAEECDCEYSTREELAKDFESCPEIWLEAKALTTINYANILKQYTD